MPHAVQEPVIATDAPAYEVRTLGCQMNAHDSERITGLLESALVETACGQVRQRPRRAQRAELPIELRWRALVNGHLEVHDGVDRRVREDKVEQRVDANGAEGFGAASCHTDVARGAPPREFVTRIRRVVVERLRMCFDRSAETGSVLGGHDQAHLGQGVEL